MSLHPRGVRGVLVDLGKRQIEVASERLRWPHDPHRAVPVTVGPSCRHRVASRRSRSCNWSSACTAGRRIVDPRRQSLLGDVDQLTKTERHIPCIVRSFANLIGAETAPASTMSDARTSTSGAPSARKLPGPSPVRRITPQAHANATRRAVSTWVTMPVRPRRYHRFRGPVGAGGGRFRRYVG